nr:photosystem I subunit IX [Persicaria lapathifolia]
MCYNIELKKRRRIFNARSKNISLRGTGTKYFMVRIFSRSIDRNQSFFPGCVNIPLFFILVIDMVGGGNND